MVTSQLDKINDLAEDDLKFLDVDRKVNDLICK